MPPARRSVTLAVLAVGVAVAAGTVARAQTPPGPTTTSTTSTTTTVPLATTPPTTVQAPAVPVDTSGRQWLVPVPIGCAVPALPDVVFVGTLLETGTPAGGPTTSEFETARFRIDQARAGAIERYSSNGVIDVRYGIDMKYLDKGEQYLVGARVDGAGADGAGGALASKVREPEPLFGGDEVIGAAESDVQCPAVADPVRTLAVDATPIEAGVISPLIGARSSILRSLLLPATIAFGLIFALALLRWILTGLGKGVGSVVRTAAEPREVRAAQRTRPRLHQD